MRYQIPSVEARECLLHITAIIEKKLPEITIKEQTDAYHFLCDLQKISHVSSRIELLEQCWRVWDLQSSDITRSFSRLDNSAVSNIIRAYQCSQYFNISLQDEVNIALKQILWSILPYRQR